MTQMYVVNYTINMKKTSNEMAEILQKLGLSDREAKVYLSLLELSQATVTKVSRKAGINRTTGYDILDSLAHKNLVRLSGKEPKEVYVAESPEKLIVMLEQRLSETEKQLETAKEYLPQLKTLHTDNKRANVKFYEGIEGLKEVYEDTLTSKEKILAVAAYEDMHATLGSYFPKYYKRRAEKGISAKGIVPKTEFTLERMTYNKEEKREAAVLPKEIFDITPDIEVYDNKMMIASWRDKLGIIIESAEIAHAMKIVFNLAYDQAKRLETEMETKNNNLTGPPPIESGNDPTL